MTRNITSLQYFNNGSFINRLLTIRLAIYVQHSITRCTINTETADNPNLKHIYAIGSIANLSVATEPSYIFILPVAFEDTPNGLAKLLIKVVKRLLILQLGMLLYLCYLLIERML